LNYKVLIFSVISSLLFTLLLFSFSTKTESELIKSEFTENLFPKVVDYDLDYNIYNLLDYKTKKQINLSVFKHKTVLLNFYEPWCQACNKEFTSLNEFAKLYKDKVVVVSISSGDDMGMLDEWQKKWNYENIQFLIDKNSKLTQYFKVRSIPATYLAENNGSVRYEFIGDRNYLSKSFSRYIDMLLSY